MWCEKPIQSNFGRRRCGTCKACQTAYQQLWYERLFREFKTRKRTHFMTLTFKPVLKAKYGHIQRWFKRCRKAGLTFRYICVAEPNPRLIDGKMRWHYHLLMFTDDVYPTDRLRKWWRGGISHGRLCRNDDISYTVKYIEKGDQRPRNSNGIGKQYYKDVENHPLVLAALAEWPNAKIGNVRDRIGYYIHGEYYEDDFYMSPPEWKTEDFYEVKKRGIGGHFPRFPKLYNNKLRE